jgi:hypothetical protein
LDFLGTLIAGQRYGRKNREQMQMIDIPNPQSRSSPEASLAAKALVDAPTVDPADHKNHQFPRGRWPFAKRAHFAVARFLITFSIAVTATVAWQSYGDAARAIVANSFQQLDWLTPQASPIAQRTSDVSAAHAPPSADQRQVIEISLDLDAVRQSFDRIAASQERMARAIDQLASGQARTTGEITKLQAIRQDILYKNSEPQQPVPVPVPRPVLRPSQSPTALTPARNP